MSCSRGDATCVSFAAIASTRPSSNMRPVDAAFQFGTMPPQQAIHRPRAHREQEPLHFVADFEVHPPCNARVTDGSEKGRTWPERSGMRHRENPYSIDLFSS